MIYNWPQLNFFASPRLFWDGYGPSLVMVNLLAPKNKITLKETICFPLKF